MAGTDWVVNEQGWCPISLTPVLLSTNSQLTRGLTRTQTAQFDFEHYEPVANSKVLRVVGVIHWFGLLTSVAELGNQAWFDRRWIRTLDLRIHTLMGDQIDDDPATSVNYDLSDPATANEQFMWHKSVLIRNSLPSFWTDRPALRAEYYGTIFVDCKSNRLLDNMMQVALTMQWGVSCDTVPFDQDDDQAATPGIALIPKLRSLIMPVGK